MHNEVSTGVEGFTATGLELIVATAIGVVVFAVLAIFRAIGVDYVQGYGISEPAPLSYCLSGIDEDLLLPGNKTSQTKLTENTR